MNNRFKRALSSILAFVMVISCMVVMNVTNVFADDEYDYTFSMNNSGSYSANTTLVSNDYLTMTSLSEGSIGSSSISLSSPGNSTIYLYELDDDGTNSSTATKTTGCREFIQIVPKVNGTIYFTISSLNSGKYLKIIQEVENSEDTDNRYATVLASTAGTSSNTTAYIQADLTKGTTYEFISTGTTPTISAITFNSTEAVASLKVSPTSLTLAPGEEATITATLSNSTDSITWDTSDSSIATVTADSDDAATATVTISDSASHNDTVDITATAGSLSAKTAVTVEITNTVSVTPTVSGTLSTYSFVKDTTDGNYVLSSDTSDSSAAYAGINGTAETSECYVSLSESGATLVDNSSGGAPTLNIPFAKAGKFEVSGTVTPTNAIGGNWALVNFGGIIYLGANANSTTKYLELATALTDTDADPSGLGAVTANQTISYDLVFDFINCVVTGSVTNGDTTVDDLEVSWDSTSTSNGKITFVTNNSGTGSTARTLVIPSVTITDLTTYVYFGVSADEVDANSSYTVVDANGEAVTDANGADVTGNTVYAGVNYGNGRTATASELTDTDYVVAYIVSSSTDGLELSYTPIEE